MAFRKSCDFDGKIIDKSTEPFLQIHLEGSISEQLEAPDGSVKYRYLTDRPNTKLAFCNDQCLTDWLDRQRKKFPFQQK